MRSAFTLELNQTARMDFAMTLGQVSQTVEVPAPRPLLQTETTQVGTVMQADAIANLPLETRNYNQLTLLMPGAVTISPASFNTGQKTFNAGAAEHQRQPRAGQLLPAGRHGQQRIRR